MLCTAIATSVVDTAESLGTVGLCFQLQENVAMAVVLNCCSKTFAWNITCCMSHTPHLLSPSSQLKWVPAHMLD